jgi:hypothetical protein
MADDIQFTLGQHSATLKAQDARLDSIDDKLDRVLAAVERNKGGLKMLAGITVGVSTLAATVGEVIHWARHA